MAQAALPWGCVVFVVIMAALWLVPAGRNALRRPAFAAVCSCVLCASQFGFLATELTFARTVLFSLNLAASGALALACVRRLALYDRKRTAILAGIATAFAALVDLAVSYTGMSLGITRNLSNYTVYALSVYAFAAPLAVCAFIGAGLPQPDERPEKVSKSESASAAGKDRLNPGVVLLLVIVAVACIASTFIGGYMFNPHVVDIVFSNTLGSAIALVAGMALAVAAMLCSPEGAYRMLATFASVVVVACVAVMTLLGSPLAPPADVALGMLSAIERLLFAVGAVVVSFAVSLCATNSPDAIVDDRLLIGLGAAFCALCVNPWPLALGMAAKHSLGFSLETFAPLALVAIAVLAIALIIASLGVGVSASSATLSDGPHNIDTDQQMALFFERYNFTKREAEVASAVLKGLSNGDTAELLGVSGKTVSYHLTHVYQKVGVRSRQTLNAAFLAFVNEGSDK